MRLVLANHSSYPRVGESAQAQRLRRAYARRETGEITEEAYLEVVRDYVREILAEQAEAGCDLVTDGQVHWYDCTSWLAARLGARVDGLLRFFDTNFYVRQPEVVGPLGGRFGLDADYAHAAAVSPRPVKAVLTGPYTLARHSIVRTGAYPDLRSLVLAYAEAVAEEVRALGAAGAGLVQVEEPSLLRYPEDAPLVREALQRARGGARLALVTYFGDAAPLWRQLLEMPVDLLGLDLTYGPRLVEVIEREGADRPLALGALDGRNTRLEDPEDLARTVDRVARVLGARGVEEVHLQPSCGLEYLPRDRARRKLERMAEAGRIVEGART